MVLVYLYSFGPSGCLGAVIGFVLAYASLSASARRGGRAPGRLVRAGLAGGAVTLYLALGLDNGGN